MLYGIVYESKSNWILRSNVCANVEERECTVKLQILVQSTEALQFFSWAQNRIFNLSFLGYAIFIYLLVLNSMQFQHESEACGLLPTYITRVTQKWWNPIAAFVDKAKKACDPFSFFIILDVQPLNIRYDYYLAVKENEGVKKHSADLQ